MPRIRIEAPAKVNLHLRVGAGRPDGYHDIDGIFLALTFGDTLEFETVPVSSGFQDPSFSEIYMNWRVPAENTAVRNLPPGENIISRAVSLFRIRTGYDKGLKITVEKRIPAGGGLGGGSSDAAATLLALNRLVLSDGGRPADNETLMETGAALGSDVPFFLNIASDGTADGTVADGAASGAYTCAARVSGRGERVQLLAMPEECFNLSFVLVNPGFSSNTASAFRLLDHFSGYSRRFIDPFIPEYPAVLPLSPRNWPFCNDFLPVFEAAGGGSSGSAGAVYRDIITRLTELGADFSGLSGSGSTCFGVFTSRSAASAAKDILIKRWPFAFETFPLARRTIPYYNM